jgi:hypothetical protein
MVNIGAYLRVALVCGVDKGIFSWEEAMVMAVDYMLKNAMTRDDVEHFVNSTEAPIKG